MFREGDDELRKGKGVTWQRLLWSIAQALTNYWARTDERVCVAVCCSRLWWEAFLFSFLQVLTVIPCNDGKAPVKQEFSKPCNGQPYL